MSTLKITKRLGLKGDDGYKVFSIRVRDDIVDSLDRLAAETNRSRNELINKMLEFAIENCEVTEPGK
ncbi:MAG: ribbon-helix-helix protein, CopG family [Oscillospiraceae bacterium]|nr:ribbon-helix-helix protein, CopG family [Oscillospiraceae bacterium]